MRTLTALALLSACKSGSVALDDSGDSLTGADSSPEESQPLDDSADDSEPPEETFALTFEIDGPWENTGVELVWISSFDDEDPFDAVFASGQTVGSTTSLEVTAPPEEQLGQVNPDLPDLLGAFYAPALFDDQDGDGVRDSSEPYVGISRAWATWLGGEIPQELLLAGLKPGWNALDLVTDNSNPTIYSIDAIPLPSNLWRVDELSIGGTVHEDAAALGALGLMVIPVVMLDGGAGAGLYADDPITDTWTLDFSGEAPAADRTSSEQWYAEGAAYLPVGYPDLDGSGSWSGDAEAALQPLCLGEGVVVVQHLDEPTLTLSAWTMSVLGWPAGWSAVSITQGSDSAPAVLDEASAQVLVMGGGCTLQ